MGNNVNDLVAEMMAGYGTLPANDTVIELRKLVARKLPRRLHKHLARMLTARGAK